MYSILGRTGSRSLTFFVRKIRKTNNFIIKTHFGTPPGHGISKGKFLRDQGIAFRKYVMLNVFLNSFLIIV